MLVCVVIPSILGASLHQPGLRSQKGGWIAWVHIVRIAYQLTLLFVFLTSTNHLNAQR